MVSWLGFRQIGVPYLRAARHAGETKYPLGKMLRLASDGITSFSYLPLQLASWLGVVVCAAAVVALAAVLILKATGSTLAWTWVAASGLALLGGIQLIAVGLLGEYVGRVFDEVRGRPLYLVQETVGMIGGQRSAPPPITV
jgi:dolichol-phosphate mannosyltransferase